MLRWRRQLRLTLVEPTGNGLGSDAFAIVWDGKELHGLNASGRSPAAWNPERFPDGMPERGWESVTVPGADQRLGSNLSQRFGANCLSRPCSNPPSATRATASTSLR